MKAGDVVMLNSGSPRMTISQLEDNDGVVEACCVWIDVKGNEKFSKYPLTSLKLFVKAG